jgi:bacterioferritin-associated ferredoxin/NAD-dependent dihydropyrimidine dehydrogenase PreA subunit
MALMVTDKCVNCGMCVDNCPTDSISTLNHTLVINPNSCTECRDSPAGPTCLGLCPIEGAITELCRRSADACARCPETVVCPCLGVTEAQLIDALATQQIRSLKDIRRQTGAGAGCMVCHRRLKRYLQERAR